MKSTIEYFDFEKLDLRVGEVVDAIVPAWSEKLIELKVNFGDEIGEKTIFSGVKQWYVPGDFLNKKFIFIINLVERKMGPAVSQGMMLMVDSDNQPQPIELSNLAQVGAIIR